jgi:hypothetical protein
VRRRVLAAAAGVVALLLAVPLALVGRAALATPAAVARQTASPSGVQVDSHHRSLAERAAWSLLAADRSTPFAEIVRTYRTVADLPALSGQPTWSLQISRRIPELRSPSERAQAYVMAGTVLALGAGDGLGVPLANGSEGAQALLSQAFADYRAAVLSDGGNEDAKYDLELLLRQAHAQAPPPTGAPKKRRPAPRPQIPRKQRQTTHQRVESRINDAGIYASGTGY